MNDKYVVVWCRKEELYNYWDDDSDYLLLWFDVEKKNYTTVTNNDSVKEQLWFDVEKKNYTTEDMYLAMFKGCGLM